MIDLVISPSGSQTINGTWATNGSGTWSTSGNWTGGVPGSGQDTAVFGTALTSGTATVTLDGSRSLASLGFSTTGGNSYVIAASGASTLTLANTLTSTAALSNSGGNHAINAPIVLGSNLNVTCHDGQRVDDRRGHQREQPGHVRERRRRRRFDPQRHGHVHRRHERQRRDARDHFRQRIVRARAW